MAPCVGAGPLDRTCMRPLVGDLRQIAGVRRIVLDDGPERGVRALAFSTGGGLDFWVLIDRSLDIGPLWWRGTPVAWQSPSGFRSPYLHNPEADAGRGFDRSLSGLLVTCGLDQTRQPHNGIPLHGRLPLTPARLLGYGELWDRDEPILFCEGEVTQFRFDGEAFRLVRRIEAPIGGNSLRILDEIENLDAAPRPIAMLYHVNLGFPLVSPESEVRLGDEVLPSAAEGGEPTISCRPVRRNSRVTARVFRQAGDLWPGLEFALAFDGDHLPFFQLWHDPRPNRGILALEPSTSERLEGGLSGKEPILEGGARRSHHLSIKLGNARSD